MELGVAKIAELIIQWASQSARLLIKYWKEKNKQRQLRRETGRLVRDEARARDLGPNASRVQSLSNMLRGHVPWLRQRPGRLIKNNNRYFCSAGVSPLSTRNIRPTGSSVTCIYNTRVNREIIYVDRRKRIISIRPNWIIFKPGCHFLNSVNISPSEEKMSHIYRTILLLVGSWLFNQKTGSSFYTSQMFFFSFRPVLFLYHRICESATGSVMCVRTILRVSTASRYHRATLWDFSPFSNGKSRPLLHVWSLDYTCHGRQLDDPMGGGCCIQTCEEEEDDEAAAVVSRGRWRRSGSGRNNLTVHQSAPLPWRTTSPPPSAFYFFCPVHVTRYLHNSILSRRRGPDSHVGKRWRKCPTEQVNPSHEWKSKSNHFLKFPCQWFIS